MPLHHVTNIGLFYKNDNRTKVLLYFLSRKQQTNLGKHLQPPGKSADSKFAVQLVLPLKRKTCQQ